MVHNGSLFLLILASRIILHLFSNRCFNRFKLFLSGLWIQAVIYKEITHWRTNNHLLCCRFPRTQTFNLNTTTDSICSVGTCITLVMCFWDILCLEYLSFLSSKHARLRKCKALCNNSSISNLDNQIRVLDIVYHCTPSYLSWEIQPFFLNFALNCLIRTTTRTWFYGLKF